MKVCWECDTAWMPWKDQPADTCWACGGSGSIRTMDLESFKFRKCKAALKNPV